MNPITNSLLVSAHIDALLAESAAEHLARSAKPSSNEPSRIASALKSVWSTLAGPAERPSVGTLPRLVDYPFRG